LSEPIEISNPLVAEMLQALSIILQQHQIDYYLVGAMARDIQLGTNKNFNPKRQTTDVDLAVMIHHEDQYYAIQAQLIDSRDFELSDIKPFKFFYKQSIELDILPFGEIETVERRFELSRYVLLSMDMSGFKEAFPFANSMQVTDNIVLNICSLEGLVVLKLIANNDDRSRTKDIIDIEHLLEVYFELKFTEVFIDYMDIADMYSTDIPAYPQLVSARVIGRKMKAMTTDYADTAEKLKNILSKRPVATWQAMLDGLND